MLGFMKGLPVFSQMGQSIQKFAFENFAPDFGESIAVYIQEFVDQAGNLTTTSIIVLIIITLLLIATIDNALNHIWHVKKRRRPAARFLVYWAILTLGPILIGAGLFISSYLVSLSLFLDVDESLGLRQSLFPYLPFLTTGMAFSLMYILIPNCYVSRRHAIIGGVISAALFEYAKYAFGAYLKSFTSYQAIYGAIAVIPTFLIWIYISWVIVILGAHITFCLSSFRLISERAGKQDIDWNIIDVCRIISVLWLAQKQGVAQSIPGLKKELPRIPIYQINEIMELLERHNWVRRDVGSNWFLSRDMSEQKLYDIYKIVPNRMPSKEMRISDMSGSVLLSEIFANYYGNLEELFQVSVVDVMES
jgi:membrane protein